MRITLGIKIIVACILSTMLSQCILIFFPKGDASIAMDFLICLLTGSLIGLLLAWRVQFRMQKFSRMLSQWNEEKGENWENPFSLQEDFGFWANQIKEFAREEHIRKVDQKNKMKILSQLVSENFSRIGEILKNIGTQNSAIRHVLTQIVEMNSVVQSVYEKVDSLSSSISASSTEVGSLNEDITAEATKIDSASNISQEAVSAAREGTGVIHEMEEGMNKIAKHVKNATQTIDKLRQSSNEIEEISSVIDDIADQTNLLALNASIEAARAGEQGRGFAVVAESVRNLAEKTQKATKEIVGMIKNLQEETSGAVNSMEGGSKEVETGVGMAAKAGMTLKRISSSIEKLNELMSQIRIHAVEQGQIKHKITTATGEIHKFTKSLFSSINEQQKKCYSLKKEMEELDLVAMKNQQYLTEIRRDSEEIIGQIATMKPLDKEKKEKSIEEAKQEEAKEPASTSADPAS